ncbi:MAG: serine hydrolase domain-containing protein [Pirellulales bacterium]
MPMICARFIGMLSCCSLALAVTAAAAQEAKPAAKAGLAEKLQPFVESHSLAGAVVLAASKEKVLDLETVGYSDVAAKTPIAPDSLFWIASMSKPITGAAMMILVDEGRVSLDDPVEKHLPEFRELWLAAEQDKDHILLKRPARAVTVRDILSHTSGLAFKSPLEQPTLDGLPLRDTVRGYTMMPLLHEPGSKWMYSNAGINTAGRIIEVVSGMPFEDFLDQKLFQPLGMKDTTFWPNEEQVARLAKSYKPNADKTGLEETTITSLIYPLADRRQRYPMPGGGLFSTAGDLAQFCRMVLRGGELDGRRYLSEEAVKQMTSKQTPDSLPDGYGVGWSTNFGGFGHGGAYSTNMNIDPTRDLITIFLVQHAGFPNDGNKSHEVFKKAAEEMFGGKE